jgi:hypothetical protein
MIFIRMYIQHMKIYNKDKAQIFNEYLGERFKTFEVASEDAPISFLCRDHEDKEYYIYVEVPNEQYIAQRENTGIAIENKHFYTLYGMMSQGMNIFWFVAFNDGYILFYLNDCLTPAQLNVLPEQTLIGTASALHIQKDKIKHDTGDGKYVELASAPSQPTIIQGSPIIGRKPKARVSKRKK